MKKPVSYKRIFAYLIDVIIVALISSLLTAFLPISEKYKDASDDLMQTLKDFQDKKIDENEALQRFEDDSYVVSKESVSVSIVMVLAAVGYFVVFAYVQDGQTLGKRLMKIKIVSKDSKKLTLTNYLIRALIINSIFLNVVDIIIIVSLNKTAYFNVNDTLSIVRTCLYITIFFMILFNADGRGLHDYLARTKVVDVEPLPEPTANLDSQDVMEAEIKEKTPEKEAKSSSKTSTTKSSPAKKKTTTSKTNSKSKKLETKK